MSDLKYKEVAEFIIEKTDEAGFSGGELIVGCCCIVKVSMVDLEDCGESIVRAMQLAHEEAKKLRSEGQ